MTTSINNTTQQLNNTSNSVIIDGSFLPFNFYEKNGFIDLSYIGNYDLKIRPLGLDICDNFYYTINNVVDIGLLGQDISRVINIDVVDRLDPCLNFVNNPLNSDYNNKISYKYIYPRTSSFDIYSYGLLGECSSQYPSPIDAE